MEKTRRGLAATIPFCPFHDPSFVLLKKISRKIVLTPKKEKDASPIKKSKNVSKSKHPNSQRSRFDLEKKKLCKTSGVQRNYYKNHGKNNLSHIKQPILVL